MDKKEKQKKKDLDLSLTMQQKFNFDSNSFDEEDTRTYKLKRKQNVIRSKREKELIKLKNKYKKKYYLFLMISIILICMLITISCAYILVKPKEITKIVEKTIVEENILFIGDSITHGYDLEKYFPNVHVVNSGNNGYTTDDIYNRLDDLAYEYNPSKIFLLIGINNIIKGQESDEIYNNILEIVSNIQQERPYAEIYLESIYPINDSDDNKIYGEYKNTDFNEKIVKINKKLKKYCSQENINYIDVYSKLIDEENKLKLDYTSDGIHLTEEGYQEVTKVLFPYIKQK